MGQTSSQADIAYDWELWIGRESAPGEDDHTFTQVRGFTALPFPDQQPEREDVTHMQSPGRTRESIPGLLPEAEWSQEKQLWPDDAGDVILKELSDKTRDGEPEEVLIEFNIDPEGGSFRETFRGEVSGYIPTGTVGNVAMANLSLLLRNPQATNPRVIAS